MINNYWAMNRPIGANPMGGIHRQPQAPVCRQCGHVTIQQTVKFWQQIITQVSLAVVWDAIWVMHEKNEGKMKFYVLLNVLCKHLLSLYC